jgi:hypothetical protein
MQARVGYAKEVQDRRGRYGEPFPALPEDVTGGDPPRVGVYADCLHEQKRRQKWVGEAGLDTMLLQRAVNHA